MFVVGSTCPRSLSHIHRKEKYGAFSRNHEQKKTKRPPAVETARLVRKYDTLNPVALSELRSEADISTGDQVDDHFDISDAELRVSAFSDVNRDGRDLFQQPQQSSSPSNCEELQVATDAVDYRI